MVASLLKRALAELLGTFILVTAVISVTVGPCQVGSLVVAAALMIGVYATGPISGGHLNPAVSLGVTIMSFLKHTEFSAMEFVVYVVAQTIGAAAAVLKVGFMWRTPLLGATSTTGEGSTTIMLGNITAPMQPHILGSNLTNTVAPDGGLLSIGLAELIYTAVLVFVVLNVATCGDEGKGMKNHYFGLAIGFVLSAAASAIGSISMCCINPAVAFAIALGDITMGALPHDGYTIGWPVGMFFFYSLFEYLGAAVACGLFILCRQHLIGKDKNDLGKSEPSTLSKFVSEFLGTFVLGLTVMLVVHSGGSAVGAVGVAASLMVMIYSLGGVSGANFNPAVSFALLILKVLSFAEFAIYIVAQLLGALVALLTSWLILRRIDVALVATGVPADSNKFGLAQGSKMADFYAELIFTWMLVFTVLNVAVRDSPNQYYGLAISFVIVVGAASSGALSGGCYNPAIALMLDLAGLIGNEYSSYGTGWSDVFFQLIAAAFAALWFKCISPSEDGDDEYTEKLDDEGDDDYDEVEEEP